MSVIWILGASGFIGQRIKDFFPTDTEVHLISHTNKEWDLIPRPNCVVNLASSPPDANEETSIVANYMFPKSIFNYLESNDEEKIKWVQAASYFELQCEYGRNDFYSLHKLKFRKWLTFQNESKEFALVNIFLPHIFGPGERNNRLIPTAKSTFQKNEEFVTSSGQQFIPILHVNDACTAIVAATKSSQSNCSALPIWYGMVKDLVQIIHSGIGSGSIKIDAKRHSVDEHYPKVSFPDKVNGWSANHCLNSIFD